MEFLEARSLLSATATTISASADSAVYGTTEVFTASVTDGGSAVGAGGSVTFFNGASVLGTSAVDGNGQATFSTSSLSAGTYLVTAIYSGYLLEDSSNSDVTTVTVTPATPTISVSAYDSTYNGTAYAATGSATGIGGVNLSSYLTLSGTTHTSAGTYTSDAWTFHDPSGNYADESGTITDVIEKANATFVVTPFSATYDGNSHSATGVAVGVASENLSNLLSFTSESDAGSYNDTWTFAGNNNYLSASGTASDTITAAVLTVTAGSQAKVYGTSDPTLSFSVSGFKSTDTESSVLSGALSRTSGEDVGVYTITQGTLVANSNYTISYTSNNLTISKGTLTVSADSQTKVYGAFDPALTFDVTGLQFSDTVGSVLSGSLTRAAGENVFTYAIGQGTLAANGNYSINFTGNNLTITQATLLVTAEPMSKVYGASDPTLTYVATGFQFADTSVTALGGTLSRATGENVGTYAISQGSLTANGNYSLSFTGDSLTVTQATLTVSANALTKVYGASDPTLTYVTTGLQFSDSVGSVLTGDLTRVTGEDVGSYGVSQGSLAATGNYAINFTGNSLTISQATLYVSATAQTKVYGTTDPTLTYVTTGLQFSDDASSVLSGTLTRAMGEDVGSYAVSLGSLAANGNYSISYTGNNLAITKAVLTVAADAQTKVYGTVDPTLTYITTGLQFSDTASSVLTGHLTRVAGENVFSYAIAEGTLAANGNYSISYTGDNLTITKATLTVTANPLTKVYGASDPTLAYVATGFQFADIASNVLSGTMSRAAGENVGTYAIGQGALTANGNYSLTFTGDNLTITQATLTVSANALTKVYGASDPALTYVTTGLQLSDTASSVLTGALSRATGDDVGSYAVGQGTLAANGNYTVTFNGNNLTITKATLTVTTNALTKVYGASDPTLAYVATGFQYSDDATGVLTGALSRATGENVGSYAVGLGTLAANGNYSISYTGSNLAITKAVLTVAADAQTKVYGAADPTLTFVTTGLQFSDTASSVLTGHLTRAAGENVFTYAITEGNLATNGNYSLNFTGDNLTITKATLTVTANPLTKVYGASDPTLAYVATGFQFADIASNVLSGTMSRAAGENVGTYAIGQGTLTANGNYSLSFTGDNLTITQATLTVSANALTKVYGASDPTLTYVTTGLQLSDTASSVLTGALSRATGDDVGSYAVGQGTLAANGNYTVTFNGNNLTITKATLTVAANALTKVYGASDPTLAYVATGFQYSDDATGVLTGALSRATGENVGSYAVNLGTLAANGNYSISYTGNNLAITKAVLTVAADAQTKVYGTADPTLTYVTTGLQFSDTASSVLTGSLTRAAGENVFTYAITEGNLATNGNYSLNFTGDNLTITKATLTVTANPLSKVYGASDPTLAYVATGFQFSDTNLNVISGTLSRATGENVGTYAIGQGSLTANGNYSLTFTGDNLTITQANLTVSANALTKVYGASDPALTYVTTGLQLSDTASSVLTGALSRATGEDVGSYAVGQGTLAANGNYTVTFNGNNLTITKAVLTVSANALTKVYGASDPTLAYVASGFQYSDDASGVLTGALSRATGENVGSYAVNLGTLAANGNYSISYTGNNLAITKAVLTVAADAQTKVYGAADPTLTFVTTGLQFSDTAGSVLTGHLTRAAGENVFTYAITEGNLATNGNYSLNFTGDNLTITKATLTVTANPLTKVYGASDPTLAYVATGFQFSDTNLNVISGTLSRATGKTSVPIQSARDRSPRMGIIRLASRVII